MSQHEATKQVRALQLPTQWHGLSRLTVVSDVATVQTPAEMPSDGDAAYFIAVVGKSRVLFAGFTGRAAVVPQPLVYKKWL